MISRATLLLDRLATLLLAIALIAAGAVTVWWWTGDSPMTSVTNTHDLTHVVDHDWWPWASAVTGIVLILLGVRWIAAHVRATRVQRLYLHGSGPTGRLDVNASKVVGAAADAFEHALGVRKASGSARRDRGQIVATINATLEPDADLRLVATAADEVSSQLAQVIGRDDLRCMVELKVARAGNELPHVS